MYSMKIIYKLFSLNDANDFCLIHKNNGFSICISVIIAVIFGATIMALNACATSTNCNRPNIIFMFNKGVAQTM